MTFSSQKVVSLDKSLLDSEINFYSQLPIKNIE